MHCHCHCPHWCTRQFWAFIFSLVTVIFTIVAVASPWYVIALTDIPTSLQSTDSVVTYTFWWKGVYETVSPSHGSSSSFTIEWNDNSNFTSSKAKDTYMVSASFSILALIFGIILSIFLLFGLVIHPTREGCSHIFCGLTKWIAVILSVVVIVLTIISWAVFISFPSALNDSNFCPPNTYYNIPARAQNNAPLWCDSFIGSNSYNVQIPPWNQTAHATWLPFVGWLFAVISTMWAIVTTLVTLCVRRHADYEHISTF